MHLSIVTAIKAPAEGLEKTKESVLREFGTNPQVEHIIKEWCPEGEPPTRVVKSGDEQIESVWMRRHDTSVFDGMLQALDQARGEWVLFLNAGDWLAQGYGRALRGALKGLSEKCDYLFFDGFTVDESDGRQFPRAASDVLQLSHFYRHVPVLHPGLVVRTSVMQAYGFNRDLNLAADFDLMVRFVVDKLSGKHVRFFGVHVVSGGLSEQHRVRARWQATGSLWRHDPSLAGRLKIFISFVRFLALHSLIVGVVHRWPWLRRTLQRIRQSHESPR